MLVGNESALIFIYLLFIYLFIIS